MTMNEEINNSVLEPNAVSNIDQEQKIKNGVSETTEEQEYRLPWGHPLNCPSTPSTTAARGFSSNSTKTLLFDISHIFLCDLSDGHGMLRIIRHCRGHVIAGRVSENPQEIFFRELWMVEMIFKRVNNQWCYYLFQWHEVSFWNNNFFIVLKLSSTLWVHIDHAEQPTSDPVSAEYTEQTKGKKLISESLVLLSDAKQTASNPVAAKYREQDEENGSSRVSLDLINDSEQTTPVPVSAENREQGVEKGFSSKAVVLGNDAEQTASDPGTSEYRGEHDGKELHIRSSVESLALVSNVEQTTSDPATAECIQQVERKELSMESLTLTSSVEQTTSDPATAECINNIEQTTSKCGDAEGTQQDKVKKRHLEPNKLVSDNFFPSQNSCRIDGKSVFWGVLILSLLTSSKGFSQGNHVSCAVKPNKKSD